MLPRVSSGRIRQVGHRSYYVESLPESASNAGIVAGEHAVAVVDSRLTPSLGKELRGAAGALADRPPRQFFLVNSHFHGDHWFGNAGFRDAVIISSEWTRTALAESWQQQVDIFAEIRPQQAGDFRSTPPVLPMVGVTGCLRVDLGGGAVTAQGMPPAHTPGDLVVRSDDDVIFAGDLVFNGHWPVLWDADVAGWLRCLGELRELPARVVVPGHGPAGGPELIDAMTACLGLLQRVANSPDGDRDALVAASPFADWLHADRIAPAVRMIRNQLPKEAAHHDA